MAAHSFLLLPKSPSVMPAPGLEAARTAGSEQSSSLGFSGIDAHLHGGLARGALHEVVTASGADALSAAGFALGLALRAGEDGRIMWVRDGFAAAETGRLDGSGLAEFGAGPARLILVQLGRSADALWAADAAARCRALGAVILETGGGPRMPDLTATRRLALALRSSGTTMILLRGGPSAPSAAMTRWRVESIPSRAMEGNAPGHPAFSATLLRHRAGIAERTWQMEWDRDRQGFTERPAISGAVVSPPVHGPDPAWGAAAGRHEPRRRAE